MFSSQLMAASAHQKELLEARARIKAQRQLAAAQAQAAHRALTVTREKASNEAKSEFMSLMCHEVRTPLNGCLASAEMLLDTTLDVRFVVASRLLLGRGGMNPVSLVGGRYCVDERLLLDCVQLF